MYINYEVMIFLIWSMENTLPEGLSFSLTTNHGFSIALHFIISSSSVTFSFVEESPISLRNSLAFASSRQDCA